MKFAILIVTYTSVKQTKRLIDSLNNGDFDFYIHLDKKVDIQTHVELFNMPNVFFIKNRIDIKWAGYTTVEAALSGIRQIAASGIKYDFVNLITGQDYPLKSARYISDFLAANVGREFILCKDFDTEWEEAKPRVDRYHFTDMASFKGKYALERLVNAVMPRRKFPLPMKLQGRETFWSLSLDCAMYVANFLENNPKLTNFLRYTWGSDEFIFQSIIMDSPFKERVVNKNYRYIVWPLVAPRPKVLGVEDYDQLIATDAIFGRKFDIHADPVIFDMLDKVNGVKQKQTAHGIPDQPEIIY